MIKIETTQSKQELALKDQKISKFSWRRTKERMRAFTGLLTETLKVDIIDGLSSEL